MKSLEDIMAMAQNVQEELTKAQATLDTIAARLETLGPGLWLHIDHASTDDPEMRAVGHAGYEWVAADRSAVLSCGLFHDLLNTAQRE